MLHIRKIELDMYSLKVRFVECLLGVPQYCSINTTNGIALTPDPSAQHNLYKFKEDRGAPVKQIITLNLNFLCFDYCNGRGVSDT